MDESADRLAEAGSPEEPATTPLPPVVRATRFAADASNAMPGLVRLGINVTVVPWVRAAGQAMETVAGAVEDIAQGRTVRDVRKELRREARSGMAGWARRLLDVLDESDVMPALPPGVPAEPSSANGASTESSRGPTTTQQPVVDVNEAIESVRNRPSKSQRSLGAAELFARGAALLDRSADPDTPDGDHPAFAAILDQLAPDEARILRLLAAGPQAAIELVVVNGVGRITGRDDRPRTMVGTTAGCRYLDRTGVYLDNLMRLGLVHTEAAEVDDPETYELLHVQPSVTDATARLESGGKARVRATQVSLGLTELGERFTTTCIPRG